MAETSEEVKSLTSELNNLNPSENPEVEPRYLDLNENPDQSDSQVVVDVVDKEDFSMKKEDLEYLKSNKTWSEIGIPEKFVNNLETSGFLCPSQIQAATIPLILKKEKITMIAQSKNGSGKTLCFGLPSVVMVDEKIPIKKDNMLSPQAIIVVPTFELVLQVATVIKNKLLKNKNLSNIKLDKIIDAKIGSVYEGGHILIGTPSTINKGLLYHKNEKMVLDELKLLAIDEADHIFMNEFESGEIVKLLHKLKEKTSLVMFSATFPKESLDKISNLKRKNVIKLIVGKKEDLTLKNVHQFYYDVLGNEERVDQQTNILKKNQTIGMIFREIVKNQSIIFVNSKKYAETLMYYLRDVEKHSVGLIMGYPMTKDEREFVIKKFSNKEFEILITTNLLSRGIDMRAVNLIINADLPEVYETKLPDYETYLHRIGRTGRFGDIGIALNLIDGPKTKNLVEKFKDFYKCEMPQLKDLKQLPTYIDKIRKDNEKKREELKENTDLKTD